MKMDIRGSYRAGMHPILYKPLRERPVNLPGSLMLDQQDPSETEPDLKYEVISSFEDAEECLKKAGIFLQDKAFS